MGGDSQDSPGRKVAVLVVDDEPDLASLAQSYLMATDERLNVETAASAEAGLDRLETEPVDCVISDYQMPQADGLEFLTAVRERYGKEMPFIMFTGKGREEVAIEALNLGANGYVQKGGEPESQFGVLADRVVRAVAEQRILDELREQKRRLSMLEELAEMGVIDWHLDTGDIYASPNLRRMYRLPEEGPLSIEDFQAIMHPDDAERIGRALDAAIEGRADYDIEHRLLLEDGSVIWTKNRAKLISENGSPRRLLGVVHNITALKDVESELHAFLDRL